MTDTATNITPSPYQTELLLAALKDRAHRLPSDAKAATLDLMLRRQWIREHRADGRLLGTGTEPTRPAGPTHFRLSHAGVRTAKSHQWIQLTRTHTIGTIAAYHPARAKRHQDIVAVQSRPDSDGHVKVLSGRLRRLITVALTDLRPAPPAALAPGELTDTWAVMDQDGTWLLLVEGTTYSAARRAARHAAAHAPEAKSRSLRGVDFLYRRLRSSEIPVTFAELHAAAVRSA
ncbi:hypothetical protein K388_05832 [Streptomyces sp. KhCrAH-43]|uniref:hypothetical protein n=1 Tax=unclassified Streptomyces TaxID=2593676 RepID=UPI00035DB668|nr:MULTISPECIES: hypothetical protein [unclassified Streptomyces]MYS33501.1 hypothetical protein [Streptomyces sp. SID4920]MYX63907.1 hypothetical protein [Streptomyces sp. SID8373]RAJ52733.1 hypothetical protein K388_05832 [Streptomyces sp. KhCrAH-43]